jgi:glutathione synthase/RimK-type ligase-like ATP-grasp enzyme
VHIAFLTSAQFAQLYEDDRLAADELRRRGHSVSPLVWTEADLAALDAFDVVVMRSPWDWFHLRTRFRAFLELLRTTRARVVNTAAQMLEFADKTYLPRLQARGVAVVPTEQLSAAELHRVPELLTQHGWTRAVLKPAFTANAVGARRFDAADASRVLTEITNPAESEPWLLQPFVPSIAEGELSFVFFGGEFSHAVRKRPLPHDWRVQHEYGGLSAPHVPTAQEIAEATQLLRQSAPGSVYGRVDAVEWEGRLHVMELEVVEPELFFRHEPRAPSRFADALGV